MTAQEQNKTQKPARAKTRWKALAILLAAAAAIACALQYAGEYCACAILKDRLCQGVRSKSQGLYTMDFSGLKIDFIGQKITLENFSLVADTAVYLQRIEEEQYNKAIYSISVDTLKINHIGIKSFFSSNELYIKEIDMRSPEIRLVGKPDRSKNEKVKYDAVHTDLYPILKQYFDALNIRKIEITDGYFDFHLRIHDNREQFGISKIDITLRDFFLNEEKFIKKNQFFYSGAIEIGSSNYVINLADSIHSITAERLQISTSDSSIFATNVMMKSSSKAGHQKNRFDVSMKEIAIQGLDISRAYFCKDVSLSKVTITEPSIKFAKGGKINRKTKKFEGASENWYPIIKGTLSRIAIDSLQVDGASLSISKPQISARPQYSVGNVDIVLEGFVLDSAAYLNKNKILYSNDLDVSLSSFLMMLPDNRHQFKAGNLMLSTKTGMARADKISIQPSWNAMDSTEKTIRISIPRLELAGLNMKRAYNSKEFNIGSLRISMPYINTRSFIDSTQASGASAKSKTRLLAALHEEYFHSLTIRDFQIQRGMVDITSKAYIEEDSLTLSGKLSLLIGGLTINSATIADETLPFLTSSVKISLDDAVVKPSRSPHTLRCGNFMLDTRKDMASVSRLSCTAEEDTSLVSTLRRLGKHSAINISIEKASLSKAGLLDALYKGKISIEALKIDSPHFQMSVFPQLKAQRCPAGAASQADSAAEARMDSIMLRFSPMEQMIARRIPREISLIKIDTLTSDSSVFCFTVRDTISGAVTSTSSNFMFKANGFYFSHDSISPSAGIMLANGYIIDISNFNFMLPGKTHIAQTGNIMINTYDSIVKASGIFIAPLDTLEAGKPRIVASSPGIEVSGADFATLFRTGMLPVDSLSICNSSALLIKKAPSAALASDCADGQLRKKYFRGLRINSLTALGNKFGINDCSGSQIMKTDFDLVCKDVSLDTANQAAKGHPLSFLATYLDARDFSFRIKENEIAARGIHSENDTLRISEAIFHNPDDSIRTSVRAESIQATGANLEKLAFARTAEAKTVSVQGARANFLSKASKERRKQAAQARKPFDFKADTLTADGICIHLDRRLKQKPDLNFPNMDLVATGIDTRAEHETAFPAKTIAAGINNFTYPLKDSVMRFHFGRVELDPIHQVFVADQIDYRPNVGRYDFYKLYDTRRSANFLNCVRMKGYGFSIIDFVKTMKMDLTRVDAEKFSFVCYDNKSMPLDSTRKPTLHDYIFDKLPIRIKSDTTVVRGAFFEMEQLTPEVGTPGVLAISNINGVVFNFTNDTADLGANSKMSATATGRLMGQSTVKAKMVYDLASPSEETVCNFMADSILLPTLNPFLENGILARVDDGMLSKGAVYFKCDSTESRGESQFIYSGLKLSLNKKDSIQEKRRGLISLLANTVVRSKNVRKMGHIYAKPDSTKSFAGYWMQSVLAGLKSTVGSIFESKEQKDDRKLAHKLLDAVTRKNRASNYILDIPDYEEVME